jgi:uncharacterized damage-inducible protein DinB
VEPDAIVTWEDVAAVRARTRGWLARVLDETPDSELTAPTQPMWQNTPAAMQVSVSDVLAHILLHERGHHGDVTTMLAQLGAQPPQTDYLVYRFFKGREKR